MAWFDVENDFVSSENLSEMAKKRKKRRLPGKLAAAFDLRIKACFTPRISCCG